MKSGQCKNIAISFYEIHCIYFHHVSDGAFLIISYRLCFIYDTGVFFFNFLIPIDTMFECNQVVGNNITFRNINFKWVKLIF